MWKGRYGHIQAKRTVSSDGKHFPSRLEARRYEELRIMELAGQIRNLELQKQFSLDVNEVHICNYRPDFCYEALQVSSQPHYWQAVTEDVKGIMTDIYRIKKRLMKACKGIDVIEPRVGR